MGPSIVEGAHPRASNQVGERGRGDDEIMHEVCVNRRCPEWARQGKARPEGRKRTEKRFGVRRTGGSGAEVRFGV